MNRKPITVLIALVALMTMMATALPGAAADNLAVPDDTAAQIAQSKLARTYIVILEGEPVVAYEGGIAGLAATRPARGGKIDPDSGAVREYVAHLESRHQALLEQAGASGADRLYDYTIAANGFAAQLTTAQVTALAQQDGVLFIVPDEIRQLHTDASPQFLGLTDPRGPYSRGIDGEDVVVGVVDTGIWPEHPSYADDGSYRPLPAGSFSGTACDFGNTSFNSNDVPFTCNNKLLAAQAFSEGFLAGQAPEDIFVEGTYLSARDEDGHGTHTSSTATGNSGVAASVLGQSWGQVSGIAPRARVAMYKACWNGDDGGCASSDLVAAIDQAVADGVDVINYSIGSTASTIGPDDISFLFAVDAGVFVSVSAGNSGPGAATVGAPASNPWVVAVGASTQSRDFEGTVILGDGSVYTGVTLTGGTDGALPLVDAADLGNTLCDPDVGFTGDVTGKIVLCERGVIARVAKSQAVFEAGGAGMILYNPSLNTLNTDNHYVPSLHISDVDGPLVRAYIDSAADAATAELTGGEKVFTGGNVMAAFSSRGPNLQSPHIIKPDVTAPGVNILAGNTPTALLGAPGQLFQAISGTSMSSPHTAGTLALLKQAHPDWTPAMAKSALMTSARQDLVKEDGTTPADPFDFGAGHIDPGGPIGQEGGAFNPGIVYDAGNFEYLGYLCDADPAVFADPEGTCASLDEAGIPIEAENLNYPSIGMGEVVGSATVTRTITNVAPHTRTWGAVVEAPAGFDVKVSPSRLRLAPGASGDYTVTFTRIDAAYDEWRFGSLTWKSTQYSARSPIAVRAALFAAPEEVEETGTDGSGSFEVQFGYDGDYQAGAHGLVAATETAGNVVDDPANDINTALATGVGITVHTINVAEGTAYARFSLFDEFTDGEDDLDLYVFDPDGNLVGASGTGTSAEEVNLEAPAAGDYFVVVHGWQTDGPDANYTLFSWNVPSAAGGGSLVIDEAPTEAVLGATGTVAYSWSGLTAGVKYLGAVSHSDGATSLGLTVVQVDA